MLQVRRKWLAGGFSFLENILLLRPEEIPSWENITIERRELLRQFRNTFQQVLPDEQIRSQRV